MYQNYFALVCSVLVGISAMVYVQPTLAQYSQSDNRLSDNTVESESKKIEGKTASGDEQTTIIDENGNLKAVVKGQSPQTAPKVSVPTKKTPAVPPVSKPAVPQTPIVAPPLPPATAPAVPPPPAKVPAVPSQGLAQPLVNPASIDKILYQVNISAKCEKGDMHV